MTENYYSLFGITPDADIKLIKAAYKVLCAKYHPDKYKGQDATEMMQKINNAYGTLSDSSKRKKYDEIWGKSNNYNSTNEGNKDSYTDVEREIEENWRMATDIYPELLVQYKILEVISHNLAVGFKISILDERNFSEIEQKATLMKESFIETYFGCNKKIQQLALEYIYDNNKEVAREINKQAVFFGNSIDYERVAEKIIQKYGRSSTSQEVERRREQVQEEEHQRNDDKIEFKNILFDAFKLILSPITLLFTFISIILTPIYSFIMNDKGGEIGILDGMIKMLVWFATISLVVAVPFYILLTLWFDLPHLF